jgi:hypothetical protein
MTIAIPRRAASAVGAPSVAAIIAGVTLMAGPAPATELLFKVTGTDGGYSFELPSSATVSSQNFGAQFFQSRGVLENLTNASYVVFGTGNFYLGASSLLANVNQFGNSRFDFTSANPYSAATPDPSAVPTGGDLIFNIPNGGRSNYALTPTSGGLGVNDVLTVSAIPELSVWASMLVGLFGLGGLMRRRRDKRMHEA